MEKAATWRKNRTQSNSKQGFPLPGRGNDREKEIEMNIISKATGEVIATVHTGHWITLDEAFNLAGFEWKNQDDGVESDGWYDGDILWDESTADMDYTAKNPHAVALGKLGGSATSERKAKTSAENGRLGGRPRKDYLVIRAVKGAGGYELVTDNGDRPQEGLAHKSAKLAYDDAALLWPTNSVWEGKRIPGGYRITI